MQQRSYNIRNNRSKKKKQEAVNEDDNDDNDSTLLLSTGREKRAGSLQKIRYNEDDYENKWE